MGIDLTGVFKSDDSVKPHVSAIVVFAQKDEAAAAQIQEAIKAHGFATDKVQKSDNGETLVYAQGEQPKHAQIVRLSDQTLVSVAGLKPFPGWVGEMVDEHGFVPDLETASTGLYERLQDIITKSDTPQADAEAMLVGYAEYLNQMAVLPTACFKMDEAVVEVVKKCSCEEVEKSGDKEHTGHQKTNPATDAINDAAVDSKKKRVANHPPGEMAPKDEEDDQKPPPDSDFVTGQKSDAILTALKGIESTITGLSAKVETVASEQAAQKKVLDGVVLKADTLNDTLKNTVIAPPVSPDRPAGDTRMRVQKDDDPRTGNFDTAFLRRRR